MGKEGYTHIVSKGETLESIAEKYYGDRSLAGALAEYNEISLLEGIKPGMSLIIPFDREELKRIARKQDAALLYNKGTVLAQTGQYEDARTYLEKAVDTDPSNLDAWYNLALTYSKLEKDEKALAILSKLVETIPSESTYHYTRGVVLRKLGKKKEALREFKKALEINPSYKEAQFATAFTLEELGKRKEAIKAWEAYLQIDSDSVWAEEARLHLDNLRKK